MGCNEHEWSYSYVRGRKDKFDYPFPVWMGMRRCKICLRIEVLKPLKFDLNSGSAMWIEEIIIVGSKEYVDSIYLWKLK